MMTRITSYNVASKTKPIEKIVPDDYEKSYKNLMFDRRIRATHINPWGFTAVYTKTGETEREIERNVFKHTRLVAA